MYIAIPRGLQEVLNHITGDLTQHKFSSGIKSIHARKKQVYYTRNGKAKTTTTTTTLKHRNTITETILFIKES
jgi:hypothetical protein